MKPKKRLFSIYGLKNRFIITILLSIILCSAVFCVLHYSTEYFLEYYFDSSDFRERQFDSQIQSLQDYVTKNSLSSSDLGKLRQWERRQPIILFEMYSGRDCIYSSFYDTSMDAFSSILDFEGQSNIAPVKLADTTATAIIYSDFTYRYYVICTVLSLAAALVLFFFLMLNSNRRTIRYICRLNEEVQILEGGDLDYMISVEGNDEITDLAKSMNLMKESFRQQMEEEQQLHNANTQLITRLSHDLRTPLTGIMLFLEIIMSGRYSDEKELKSYLEKIKEKTDLVKKLSDHLFDHSVSDTQPVKPESMDMKVAFGDAVDGLVSDLKAYGFSTVTGLVWSSCRVSVIPVYVHRIFENVASNIMKYADSTLDVSIETVDNERYCGFSILNACGGIRSDVRSSRVGINSIRCMMQDMGGICMAEKSDSVFEMVLLFPKESG